MVKRGATIYKTLRQNLRIFLTWLYTTDELKNKATDARPIVEAICKILPERVLVDKWVKRYSRLLEESHTDVSLLKDQILPINEEAENADVEEDQEGKTNKSDPAKVNNPVEDIASLPKSKLYLFFFVLLFCSLEYQSKLLVLLRLSQNITQDLTQKETNKLIKYWPDMATTCLT